MPNNVLNFFLKVCKISSVNHDSHEHTTSRLYYYVWECRSKLLCCLHAYVLPYLATVISYSCKLFTLLTQAVLISSINMVCRTMCWFFFLKCVRLRYLQWIALSLKTPKLDCTLVLGNVLESYCAVCLLLCWLMFLQS